jgi:FKBP-type peptidyl-prolyl cis-trans isomerase 2
MKLKWLKGVVYLQRSETELTLDANHPLAGKALNFEVLPPSKVNL